MAENDGQENNGHENSENGENSNQQQQQNGTTGLPSMPIPATGPSAEVQAEYSTEYARRGLQRYPGPVDADNVDHLILSGDHVLDDILGQGEIATEFAKLLEEGEGDQRQKVKAFLESQGIDPSAVDAPRNTNQQGGGSPFETGGPMSGMYGPGRGGMISPFGNGFDTQRMSRGGGYIPYSARRQAGPNMRNPLAPNFGADPSTVPPVSQVNGSPGVVTDGQGPQVTRPSPSNALVRLPANNATGPGGGLGPTSSLLPRNPAGQTSIRGPMNNMGMGGGGFGGGGGLGVNGGGRGTMGSMMPYQQPSAGRGGSGELSQLIEEERRRATECSDSMGQGLNTFILLDNSTNMAGEGLEQAKEFIENFLQGLEENSMDYGLEENVSLITFGGDQARVQQHLTNEFQCLRSKLASIQCYGPDHLSHALILVTGGLERGFEMIIGNHSIVPRILLLTDGVFATAGLQGMTGMMAGGGRGQDFAETAQLLQNILQSNHMKLFFIPVGNANMEFKAIMQNFPSTKIVEASDLKIVTRNHLHHRIAGEVTELGGGGNVSRDVVREVAAQSFTDLEDRDFNVVLELLHEDQQYETQRRERRHQGGGGPGAGGLGGMSEFGGGMGGGGMEEYGGGGMGGLGRGGMGGLGRGGMGGLGGSGMGGLGGGGMGRGMGGLGSGMGGGGMEGYGGGGMGGLGRGGMGGLGRGGLGGLGGSGMGGLGVGGMGRGMGGLGGGMSGLGGGMGGGGMGFGGGGMGMGGGGMGLGGGGMGLGGDGMGLGGGGMGLGGGGMGGLGRGGMGGLGGGGMGNLGGGEMGRLGGMSGLGGGGIGGLGGRGMMGLGGGNVGGLGGGGMGSGRGLNNNSNFQSPGPRQRFP